MADDTNLMMGKDSLMIFGELLLPIFSFEGALFLLAFEFLYNFRAKIILRFPRIFMRISLPLDPVKLLPVDDLGAQYLLDYVNLAH